MVRHRSRVPWCDPPRKLAKRMQNGLTWICLYVYLLIPNLFLWNYDEKIAVGFEIANFLPYDEVPFVTVNGLVYVSQISIGLYILPKKIILIANMAIQMLPYYCCILPAVLLWLMIREAKKKERELLNISTASTATSSAASAEVIT